MSVQFENLCLSRQGRVILKGLSMTAHRGQITGIIGPNGAGKSTLLSTLMGLMQAEFGRILVDGTDISGYSAAARAPILGWLPQMTAFCWPMAVRDIVALGAVIGPPEPQAGLWPFLRGDRTISADHFPADPAPDQGAAHLQKAIETSLDDLQISHLAARPVTELSGGEQALVALARLLMPDALQLRRAALLVDEPLQSLDPKHQLMVLDCLRRYADRGAAVIVVFHDLNLAHQYCDRLMVLKAGVCIAEGEVAQIMSSDIIGDTFDINPKRFLSGDAQQLNVSQKLAATNQHAFGR